MEARVIQTKFWKDGFIAELAPIEKLIFNYLITNEYVNIINCYECTDRQIKFDTGCDQKQLDTFKDKVEKAGKIIFRDGWVIIKNGDRYQKFTGEKNDKAKSKELSRVPSKVNEERNRLLEGTLHTPIDTPTEGVCIPTSNQYPVISNQKPVISNNKYASIDDIGLEEVSQLSESLQVPQAEVIKCIEELEDYCASKGKKYHDYLATLRNWVRRKKDEGKIKAAPVQHVPEDTGTHAVPYPMRQDLTSKMSMP